LAAPAALVPARRLDLSPAFAGPDVLDP